MNAAKEPGDPPDTELRPVDSAALAALAPGRLFDLDGRVAIVTGASGGIGSALAVGLAAAGAHVLLTDHPDASLERIEEVVAAGGGTASSFSVDLLDEGAPAAVVAAALSAYGRVDVLVNNAGVNRREPISEVSRGTWDRIAAVNLRIPFELSRAAAEAMAEGGSIVQIGSLNNAIGLSGVSVYGAHKAALCQLAKSMAVEWAGCGVRVNALCPGFMLTPLSKPLWDDPSRGRWILDRSPMRRPGYPQELVGTLLLLASEAGSFITGQTFYVDGGWLAGTSWDESADEA